jgi:hypothetical protein
MLGLVVAPSRACRLRFVPLIPSSRWQPVGHAVREVKQARGLVMTDDATGEVPVSTTFELPGYAVERTVGVAWGLIVRSIGVAKG